MLSLAAVSCALVPPPPSTVIVGGGPAGLATAIMLAKRGYKKITVLDRLEPPAAPDDLEVWSDTARHYLIGLNGRGQRALKTIGAWDDVLEPFCSTVVGRKDWNPGASVDEGIERIFTDRGYLTRVIPRARMVSCLHRHVLQSYAGIIDVRHGVEVQDVRWTAGAGAADERAVLTCVPCVATGDAEACEATEEPYELDATLLVGADGSRRTIANAMEAEGTKRFRVNKFEDTNVRVYKTVPLTLPADWRGDINYSCRTTSINFDALPTLEGEYCGVLLIKPDDVASQSLESVEQAREYFDELLPQFSPSISDVTLQQVIAKPPSRLPTFRYVGPNLHRGASTVLLGDAIHSVKPYFGLGVNSAFEDVDELATALDTRESLGDALHTYSTRRGPEAKALVSLSRSFDKSGLPAFITFILPLILDGIFHGAMPKLFAPNSLAVSDARSTPTLVPDPVSRLSSFVDSHRHLVRADATGSRPLLWTDMQAQASRPSRSGPPPRRSWRGCRPARSRRRATLRPPAVLANLRRLALAAARCAARRSVRCRGAHAHARRRRHSRRARCAVGKQQ